MTAGLAWLPASQRFTPADLLYWKGRGHHAWTHAASRIDTAVLGPHASAAFPEVLRPFIAPTLTRRKQFDFSDAITSHLGRAWALADPHVMFIENPHSRLVLDANRAPPEHPLLALREFYARLQRQQAGEKVAFTGVDAIRPVTFGGEPVLIAPHDEATWLALDVAMTEAIAQGVAVYRSACQQVVDAVLAARPHQSVVVISLHDTMNTKMRSDGAIVVERPEADRLPEWVNFGNRGDAQGDEVGGEALTLPAATLRSWAAAWREAFSLPVDSSAISLNLPYRGAFETLHFGDRLRAHGGPHSGALQVEFLRETLLGPTATQALQTPGTDWPAVDEAHITRLAIALTEAGGALRRQAV